MPSQEKVDRLVENSNMSEEEVREWLADSSVSASDVAGSSHSVYRTDCKGEEELIEQAVSVIVDQHWDAEDVEDTFIYELCDDLGIRYMTDEVAERAREELRDDD